MTRDRMTLAPILLATLLVPATTFGQVQIQIRGNVIVQPNGVVRTDDDSEGYGDGQLFSENRDVSNALRRIAADLKAIDGANEAERDKRLGRTIRDLQTILELDEDFWFPTNEKRSHFRSAKSQAEEIIESLPDDGKAAYLAEYGPEAKAALERAVGRNDVAAIEEVTRRYFHTPAGIAATYRLGCLQLDRAEALAAALLFDRVRRSGDRTFEPRLSLLTAVAWGRAGLPEKSVDTLEDFRSGTKGNRIQVGGRSVALYEGRANALPWLVDVLGVQPGFRQLGREEWTMFRGDPSRTASSRPASPLWREKWRYATIEDPGSEDEKRLVEIVAELRKLEKQYRDRGRLVTPAMHPIVVGDSVVLRTLHNVRALRLDSGKLHWRSEAWDKAFDGFLENGLMVAKKPTNQDRRVAIMIQQQQNNGRLAVTPAQKFITQRAWRDLTAGTVSSDGRLVYSVEDLDFLGGYNNLPRGIILPGTGSSNADNKLMAVELKTGMLKWEIGGPSAANGLELDGSFFLGPPLPLSGRLYTLLERKGEIQLVMFEVTETPGENGLSRYEPQIRWSQPLVAPRYELSLSPLRQMAGISPSYADGMLVCSTAAGAVVAVDLSRRQLAWGYPYRLANGTAADNAPFGRRIIAMPTGDDDEDRWLDSAPTIADGFVVVTPRDSSELHCIDLVTGKAAWPPKPRADGLYVAGVHEGNVVVVGRSQVQAWRLSDGTPAWADPVPVGMPSGRGVQVGSLYHLPLQEGAIVTIDLKTGRMLAKSKSKSGRIPGNLVAANGTLVSLAPDQVIAFEPLAEVRSRIDSRLDANADDPAALAERGELRLHRGETTPAMDDLRRAIDNGAPIETKALYVDVLLEGLRLDFETYRELAESTLPLVEEVDRRRAYMRLHASGLERAGEFQKAFEEYARLAGLESGQLQLEQTSGRLRVRTDRWIRPRLARLLADAPEAKRTAMEQALRAELDEAQTSGSTTRLGRLADAYTRLLIADETRKAYLDALDPEEQALERSVVLERLRRSDSPETSGFATAELARSALEATPPRVEDAVVWFDDLANRFADVICLEGRTGAQLVAEWSGREDVEQAVANPSPWIQTKMKATSKSQNTVVAQSFPLPVEGSPGPYLDGWTFELDNTQQNVVARDEYGRVRWKVNVVMPNQRPRNALGSFVRVQGHVAVCCLGTYFCAVDALAPKGRVLWKAGLLEPGDPVVQEKLTRVQAGIVRVLSDRYHRPLGRVGAVTSEAVYYTSGTRVYAADLLTGDVLWERRGVPRGATVTADDDFVLVYEEDADRAQVLRADDGEKLGDRPALDSDDRLLTEGRHVLGWATIDGKRVLALLDVVGDRVVWSTDCHERAKFSVVAGESLAVYEPSGRFRVLDVAAGRPLVTAQLAKTDNLVDLTVLRGPDRYLVFPNDTGGPGLQRVAVGTVGVQSRIVHGTIVAFDRRTGEQQWTRKIEEQGLPLDQALGAPTLVLTAQRMIQRVPGQRINTNRFKLALLDTRTGELVLDENVQRAGIPFSLQASPAESKLDYSFYRMSVNVEFVETDESDASDQPDASDESPKE